MIRSLRYMLDTNTIIDAKNRRPPCVLERLLQHDPSEIAISIITLAELEVGNVKSMNPIRNRMAMLMFLSEITVLPFDVYAAFEYGDIRGKLEKQGMKLGGNDFLIAAHARALDLTLVTNNTREFSRVERLKIENWNDMSSH